MKNIGGIRLGGRAPSEEYCHGTESDLKREKKNMIVLIGTDLHIYLSRKKKKKTKLDILWLNAGFNCEYFQYKSYNFLKLNSNSIK